MKIIEKNEDKVVLLIAIDKLDHLVFAALTTLTPVPLYLLWQDESYFLAYSGLIILALAIVTWGLFVFSLYWQVAIFDLKNGVINLKARIMGINLKGINIPLEDSRLAGESDRWKTSLYVVDSKENRFLIGFSSTLKRYERILNEILKYVPIKYDKNF